MFRGIILFAVLAGLAFGGILNSDVVDPSLFRVTTFASGLDFPAGFQPLPDGSLGVETSPTLGYAQGQLLRFTDPQNSGVANGSGTVIYQSSASGLMTGLTQVGNLYAIGNDGDLLGPNGDHSISLVAPGATPASPLTLVASINFNYAQPWEHD